MSRLLPGSITAILVSDPQVAPFAKVQQVVVPPLHPQSAEQLLADAYGAALADTAAVETAIASNESRKVVSLFAVIVILLLERLHIGAISRSL